MGYIFQQFNLLPYLSVLDNVLLPCRFSALRRQRAEAAAGTARASAEALLERVGLGAALWARPAAQLSVGQQQRVAAARALIGQPELVIADEPTSALDAALRDSFMALLLQQCRDAGSTLVFVSHDERLAARLRRNAGAGADQPRRAAASRMKAILGIALRSAWSRRGTLALVLLSVALSTLLLLGVERLRSDVRENFSQSVSGTDLIVGARGGSLQLLLYAVFRVGGATNNVRMDSLEAIAEHRAVAWMVPLSLGDSHRGFPVLATTPGYFEHFRYGDRQPLQLAQGRRLQRRPARAVRGGAGRRGGRPPGLPARRQAHARPRRRRDARCRTCGQALQRGRHPAAHRHAGGPHAAHQPAGDGSDPPRLGGRRAAAGAEDLGRAGTRRRPEAEAGDGRADRPEEPRRGLCGAARGGRLRSRSR